MKIISLPIRGESQMATKKGKGKKVSKKSKKKVKTGKRGSNKVRDGKVSKKKVAYPPFGEKKNIGNYAKNMILQGKSTTDIVDAVVRKFEESKINSTAVSYYRAALETEGFDVPAAN